MGSHARIRLRSFAAHCAVLGAILSLAANGHGGTPAGEAGAREPGGEASTRPTARGASPAGDVVGETDAVYRLTAHHVRYRVARGRRGPAWRDHPRFGFWKASRGNRGSRREMYLSEPWRPDPADVTQVVVLVAGQQGLRGVPDAFANVLTGQEAGWRPERAGAVRDVGVSIRKRSVAGEILRDGRERSGARYGFDPGHTLVLLAFDAGFNHLLSSRNKERAVRAYRAWLDDRVGSPSRVRRILVAGTSRGGCLALRLARDLLKDARYAGARILVGTLDGVCCAVQHEGGTVLDHPMRNPLNPESFAYRTDLAAYLPASAAGRTAIRQVVGGAPAVDVGPVEVAHGFVDAHVADPAHAWPFSYAATWVDLPHAEVGRPWRDDTAGALLAWLAEQAAAGARTADGDGAAGQ